ncbi:hypothetical protein [Bradyrhizobium sp. dw_78]|uniref:hypothetical protein n=1 Tax=Bradyrhizobium sp. dw_78 TaxID=2719793 RepID=UPI001BD32D08|nr:hypothetical protein [Bradyrhizobium sp. dw_78]
MVILDGFARFQPFWRAQAWAAECLISVHGGSGDVRWAIAAQVLRGLAALQVVAHRLLASWAQNIMRRAWRGARFAAVMTAADTMVAAGDR